MIGINLGREKAMEREVKLIMFTPNSKLAITFELIALLSQQIPL